MPDYRNCRWFKIHTPDDDQGLEWCKWRDAECSVPFNITCPILELLERQHQDGLTIIALMQDIHVMENRITDLEKGGDADA